MGSKVLSIEIGQQLTRICEVDFNKKNPHVYNCISFETPVGVIEDGFIRDKLALATVLREQLNAANIKSSKVIFTLSSTKIANREAVIPMVNTNQIQGIVNTNAKDYFPVNIDEYDITYSVLEKINTKEVKQIRLLVLAAPALLVKGYFELADMMNFHIASIDYTGNSSYQLLRSEVKTGINLIVQINDQNSIINLMENENLLLQRMLPYGTNTVSEAVISNSVFHISGYADAMRLISKDKIINEHFDSNDDDIFTLDDVPEEYTQLSMKENAKSDVTSSLGNLLSNISRVIDYFVTKHPGKKIECIYVTGEGSRILGIEQLIKNEMGFEVKLLQQLTTVTFPKTSMQIEKNQSIFLSCIGAAIAPIDFTPSEYNVKQVSSHAMVLPLILLFVCILGSAAIVVSSIFIYNQAEDKYDEAQHKVDSIRDIKDVYVNYQTAENDLKNVEAFDKSTENASEKFLDFIAELEQKTPNGIWVRTLELDNGTITIRGTYASKEILAKYTESLTTFENLQVVYTKNYTEKKGDSGTPITNFETAVTFK